MLTKKQISLIDIQRKVGRKGRAAVYEDCFFDYILSALKVTNDNLKDDSISEFTAYDAVIEAIEYLVLYRDVLSGKSLRSLWRSFA